MNKKEILKKMAGDCIPTIFALCLTGLYSVIDGLFIGRAVGDQGLAAINLAWPVPAVITALGIGAGIGGSVLYSRHLGKKENKEASAVFYVTVTLLLITGLLIGSIFLMTGKPLLKLLGAEEKVYHYAWDYVQIISAGALFQVLGAGFIPILRNRRKAFEAMVAMTAGMLVNIILNYILMFQVKIGIRGAAVGTVAAQFIVVCIAVACLYGTEKEELCLCIQKKTMLDILKTGLPGFGLSIAPSVVLIFTNYRCAGFGGDTAVACYAVISYVVFPIQSMLTGVGDGIQPMVSFYYGAGNEEVCCYIKKIARIFLVGFGIFFLVIVILVSPKIPGIFGMSEEGSKMFVPGMRMSAAAFLFMGNTKLNISYMNATLRVKQAMALVYGEMLVVAPILLLSIPALAGINGVWISLPLTQAIMLLIYAEYVKWIKTKQ